MVTAKYIYDNDNEPVALDEAEQEKPGHEGYELLNTTPRDPQPEVPEKWQDPTRGGSAPDDGEDLETLPDAVRKLQIRDDLFVIDKQTGFVYLEDKHAIVVGKLYLRGIINDLLNQIQDPANERDFITIGPVTVKHTRDIDSGKPQNT